MTPPDNPGVHIPVRAIVDTALSPVDVRVLAAISHLVSESSSKHWTTATGTRLANMVCISEGHLRRSLRRLDDQGYIKRVMHTCTDGNTTRRMSVLWETPLETETEKSGEGAP